MRKHNLFFLLSVFALSACSAPKALINNNLPSLESELSRNCKLEGKKPNNNSSDYQVLNGTYHVLAIDNADGSHEYKHTFRTENKSYDLDFNEDFDQYKIPKNIKIDLAAIPLKNNALKVYTKNHDVYFTKKEDCNASILKLTLTNKTVGIYKIIPTNQEITDETLAELKKMEDYVTGFYTKLAREKWKINVKVYPIHSDCSPSIRSVTCLREIREFNNQEGIDPFYTVIWGGWGQACGLGELGGNNSWVSGSCQQKVKKTMVHELGHNFGLLHGSRLRSSGNISEYGDPSSIMGRTQKGAFFNSPQKIYLNLYEEESLKTIGETQKVFLAPIEYHHRDLLEGEIQHAVINKDNKNYYISTRKHKGMNSVSGHYDKKIFIHTKKLNNSGIEIKSNSLLIDILSVGESLVLPESDIKIDFLDFQDSVAEVDIYYNSNDPKPGAKNFPSFERPVSGNQSITFQHSGLWTSPFSKHQGFDIEYMPSRNEVLLYWYTFSDKYFGGAPKYYLGTGTVSGDQIADLKIYSTSGGRFADLNSSPSVDLIGEARLYFTSCSSGMFEYNTSEHARGSMPIEKFAANFNNCNLSIPQPKPGHHLNGRTNKIQMGHSGSWNNPDIRGQGFSMKVIEHSNKVVMYWYTYDLQGNQKWYMSIGEYADGAKSADLIIYDVNDGIFDHMKEANVDPWGEATMEVDSCSKVSFSYQSNDGTFSQNIDLSRLSPNVNCTNELAN